jgi:hypothetical protein
MPIGLFTQLVEFRNAALRAQAMVTEKKTPPGAFRSSLAGLPSLRDAAPDTGEPPPLAPPEPRTRRERAEHLFLTPEERLMWDAAQAIEFATRPGETPSSEVQTAAEPTPAKCLRCVKRQVHFPRIFVESIPDGVATLIGQRKAGKREEVLRLLEKIATERHKWHRVVTPRRAHRRKHV